LMGGLKMYAELVGILGTLPQLDRSRALALAEAAAARGAEEKLSLLFTLVDLLMLRLARTGATGQPPETEAAPNEHAVLTRLSATHAQGRAWAEAAHEISTRARHGMAVNLDPAALVLDTLFKMGQTAPR
jgi:DNA polymerase III subunit delta'